MKVRKSLKRILHKCHFCYGLWVSQSIHSYFECNPINSHLYDRLKFEIYIDKGQRTLKEGIQIFELHTCGPVPSGYSQRYIFAIV